MPVTQFNAKTFNPEVFGKYMETIPRTKRNELLKSRAVVSAPQYVDMMREQTGSYYVTVPLFGRIGGAPVNYDGNTDITADAMKTFSHSRIVVGRAKGWIERDFSHDITGGVEFMDVVGQQVATYWDDINQDILLSILKGIFAMTGTENEKFVKSHTYDVTEDKDKAKQVFNPVTLNNALQQAVGQNKSKFSLAIMHSQIATNLENLQILEYLKYTDKDGVQRDLTLATLNGRLVLIDDSMPTEEVPKSGSVEAYTKYTTYVLGEGAFEFTNPGAKVPYEMFRDPKTNGGQDTLYSRERVCYAPYGISFTKASVATLSPTNAELENGANWELVNDGSTGTKEYIDHKAIAIARIITKG
jgi:hypothetical protein|nr:MAG TPA: major capsid protein [Caudoviricetes sp.]